MIIKKIDIKTFDEYASKLERFSQFQYSEFAIAATNYNSFYGVYDNDKLVAVFRGWKRKVNKLNKVPFIGNYEFIIRRSFVTNWEDFNANAFSKSLKKFMKEESIYLFSLSPAEPFEMLEQNLFPNSSMISKKLSAAGFVNKIDNDFNLSRSACFEQAVYLKYDEIKEVEKTFKKDTMRKVRKAQKVGVSISQITADEISNYYYLFDETANRDDFSIKGLDFYSNLAKGFKDNAFIYISKLDLNLYKEFILENQPNKTDIINTIDSLNVQEIILGLAICLDSDMQTYYHSGATSNLFRETMHNYLLHYTAITDSYNRNKLFYNFGAINGSLSKDEPNFSLYQFKSRFGSTTIKMQGEFILFENLLAKLLFKMNK